MRSIIAYIFKYLAFALFIIVTMLYMEDFDFRRQAIVLLAGIVGIDVIFGVAGAIRKAVERSRRKKLNALKRSVQEAKEAKRAEAKTAKAEKKIEKLENKLQKIEKRNESRRKEPILALPAPKEAGSAVLTAAENTWGSIKEKSAALGSAIKEKFSSDNDDSGKSDGSFFDGNDLF